MERVNPGTAGAGGRCRPGVRSGGASGMAAGRGLCCRAGEQDNGGPAAPDTASSSPKPVSADNHQSGAGGVSEDGLVGP